MSYTGISQMVQSTSLRNRLVGCAATEGIDPPEPWVDSNLWLLCATIGDSDWSFAVDNYTLDKNLDTGIRPDVISDQAILSAVQAVQTP